MRVIDLLQMLGGFLPEAPVVIFDGLFSAPKAVAHSDGSLVFVSDPALLAQAAVEHRFPGSYSDGTQYEECEFAEGEQPEGAKLLDAEQTAELIRQLELARERNGELEEEIKKLTGPGPKPEAPAEVPASEAKDPEVKENASPALDAPAPEAKDAEAPASEVKDAAALASADAPAPKAKAKK